MQSFYFDLGRSLLGTLDSESKKVQWVPLNGITFGLRQTGSINQTIPLTNKHFDLQALDTSETLHWSH
jgi:hypothetical protein